MTIPSFDTTAAEPLAARRFFCTSGYAQGAITRLISPGDLGELTKPFVFLDRFEFSGGAFPELPMHPHSGIATHTTILDGSLSYADSTGKSGRLPPQSIEYMQAGGGVWHTGKASGGRVRGFQLWLALPPELELAPPASHYVEPAAIPGDDRVRLLLGTYRDWRSPIPYPAPVTYLHVRLRDGEAWAYQPAPDHDVAWLAVSTGAVVSDETEIGRQVAVFEEGTKAIDLVAVGDTELVIGSAVRHPHELVTGMYSVHTSEDALARGEAGYRSIPKALRSTRAP